MIRLAAICLVLMPCMAAAFEPFLPDGAVPVASESVVGGVYRLPTGVFADGAVPLETVEGRVARKSWRIVGISDKTAAIARSLEEQLIGQGYEVVLACDTEECGGFDFRFAVEVMSPPNMFVDLADYHFIAARRKTGAVGIMISHTALAAMVQVVDVSRGGAAGALDVVPAPELEEMPRGTGGAVSGPLAQSLATQGKAVLEGLIFGTGASELGVGPFEVLDALAEWLRADEARRVMLVGHTDSEGDLERNIALSQARAEAVLSALVEGSGIAPEQIAARGIGFLAPRDTNTTETGREANRRVEVVVLP